MILLAAVFILAFAIPWESLPPFASLMVALVTVTLYVCFAPIRKD